MTDNSQTLSFASFEDLQTRLLLMPRVEEEGVGALATAADCDISGYALHSLHDKDVYDNDFCHILSAIREAETPLVCRFVPAESAMVAEPTIEKEGGEEEEKKDDDSSTKDEESSIQHVEEQAPDNQQPLDDTDGHDDDAANNFVSVAAEQLCSEADAESIAGSSSHTNKDTDDRSILTSSSEESNGPPKMQLSSPTWSDLTKWTSRVKKSSVEFSNVAASTAVQFAMAAKERAAVANNTPDRASLNVSANEHVEPAARLYIHTSSGAWLPLPDTKADAFGSSGELQLTNSSVISVRISATEPCVSSKYSFQWYASSDDGDANQKWERLEGATTASFQPCATEVGYRLRCVVRQKEETESGTTSDDECARNGSDVEKEVTVETSGKVYASEQLLNGSRQALQRGTSFGGLVGKDKATGRTFSIKIQTTSVKDTENNETSTSAVTIYQVSGKTAEPMHPEDEPIVGVTARVDFSTPKDFYLVFTRGIPPSASMVGALATENAFLLQASTRLGRESLLLSLGIANFTGKLAKLSPSTVLYRHSSALAEIPAVLEEPHDDDGCSSDDETVSVGKKSISSASTRQRITPSGTPERQASRPDIPLSPQSHSSRRGAHEQSASIGSVSLLSSDSDDSSHTLELEQEVALLREKLERKNKVVSELQRQIAESETLSSKKEEQVKAAAKALQQSESEKQSLQQSLRLVEKKQLTLQDKIMTLQSDHKLKAEALEGTIASQAAKMADLEKTIRTLQNEKAVLSAGVEARENKLTRMDELQRSYSELSSKMQDEDVLREEIALANRRCDAVSKELELARKSLTEKDSQIEHLSGEASKLSAVIQTEREKNLSHSANFEAHQLRIQKLIAERNNYKQKADSLSKEMARICRNGRSIRDVERILADEASLRQEVELLRQQKRTALDERDHYRTAYEQARSAQQMAGLDADSISVLERNVELERLLSELTEYIHAKEMQLDTLMKVNEAIQQEMREMAKSTMSKNLSRNDV